MVYSLSNFMASIPRTTSIICTIIVILVCLIDVAFCASNSITKKNWEDQVAHENASSISQLVEIINKLRLRVDELEAEQHGAQLPKAPGNACMIRLGKDGKDGQDGRDGREGRHGMPGRHGFPGQRGMPGMYGMTGRPGPRGMPGVTIALPPLKSEAGPPGPPGPAGSTGPTGSPGTLSGGTVYVRWGRTSCPNGASRVYHGRVGNSHYKATGGGSTYLCLVNDPKFGRYNDKPQNGGYVYGTEYHVIGSNPFITQDLTNHDVPCAVCHVISRGAHLMVPGTYACPAGWFREYEGYLMTSSHRHKHPSEYICVDIRAETIPGRGAGLDGSLLSLAEGRCGALPCPPYVEYRELTCVVCTK